VTRTTVQMRGWHLIEAEGDARAGLSFSLQWRENGAGIANVTEEDTFALAATEQLWRHERHMVLPNDGGELDAVRYDLAPHYAAFDGLRVGPDERLPIGTRVTEDRWHTVWTVPEAGAYRLFIQAFRQKFDIRIDGSDP
jgi:hypothetical protein